MEYRNPFRLALAALAVVGFAGIALAGQNDRPRGVVELFTSQGCNSCPPADELFAEIAAKQDIVALAYHVDYWDYLGWRDTLARSENTARQNEYMRAFGSRSVYTPQAVINGRTHVSGANRTDIHGTIDSLAKSGKGMMVDVDVTKKDGSVIIQTGAAADKPSKAHLVLVYFDPPQIVDIAKGENNGRRMTYWNAVTDIEIAGMWHGEAARFELPISEIAKKGGCAVLLQEVGTDGLPGPILGAAIIRKPTG